MPLTPLIKKKSSEKTLARFLLDKLIGFGAEVRKAEARTLNTRLVTSLGHHHISRNHWSSIAHILLHNSFEFICLTTP